MKKSTLEFLAKLMLTASVDITAKRAAKNFYCQCVWKEDSGSYYAMQSNSFLFRTPYTFTGIDKLPSDYICRGPLPELPKMITDVAQLKRNSDGLFVFKPDYLALPYKDYQGEALASFKKTLQLFFPPGVKIDIPAERLKDSKKVVTDDMEAFFLDEKHSAMWLRCNSGMGRTYFGLTTGMHELMALDPDCFVSVYRADGNGMPVVLFRWPEAHVDGCVCPSIITQGEAADLLFHTKNKTYKITGIQGYNFEGFECTEKTEKEPVMNEKSAVLPDSIQELSKLDVVQKVVGEQYEKLPEEEEVDEKLFSEEKKCGLKKLKTLSEAREKRETPVMDKEEVVEAAEKQAKKIVESAEVSYDPASDASVDPSQDDVKEVEPTVEVPPEEQLGELLSQLVALSRALNTTGKGVLKKVKVSKAEQRKAEELAEAKARIKALEAENEELKKKFEQLRKLFA